MAEIVPRGSAAAASSSVQVVPRGSAAAARTATPPPPPPEPPSKWAMPSLSRVGEMADLAVAHSVPATLMQKANDALESVGYNRPFEDPLFQAINPVYPLVADILKTRAAAPSIPPPDRENVPETAISSGLDMLANMPVWGPAAIATPGPMSVKGMAGFGAVPAARYLLGEGELKDVGVGLGQGALFGAGGFLPKSLLGMAGRALLGTTAMLGGRRLTQEETPTTAENIVDTTFGVLPALEGIPAAKPATNTPPPTNPAPRSWDTGVPLKPEPPLNPETVMQRATRPDAPTVTKAPAQTIDGLDVMRTGTLKQAVPPEFVAQLERSVNPERPLSEPLPPNLSPAKPLTGRDQPFLYEDRGRTATGDPMRSPNLADVYMNPAYPQLPYYGSLLPPIETGRSSIPYNTPQPTVETPLGPNAANMANSPTAGQVLAPSTSRATADMGNTGAVPRVRPSTGVRPPGRLLEGGPEGPQPLTEPLRPATTEPPRGQADVYMSSVTPELPLAPEPPAPKAEPPLTAAERQRAGELGIEVKVKPGEKRSDAFARIRSTMQQAEQQRAGESRPDVQADMISETAGTGETFGAARSTGVPETLLESGTVSREGAPPRAKKPPPSEGPTWSEESGAGLDVIRELLDLAERGVRAGAPAVRAAITSVLNKASNPVDYALTDQLLRGYFTAKQNGQRPNLDALAGERQVQSVYDNLPMYQRQGMSTEPTKADTPVAEQVRRAIEAAEYGDTTPRPGPLTEPFTSRSTPQPDSALPSRYDENIAQTTATEAARRTEAATKDRARAQFPEWLNKFTEERGAAFNPFSLLKEGKKRSTAEQAAVDAMNKNIDRTPGTLGGRMLNRVRNISFTHFQEYWTNRAAPMEKLEDRVAKSLGYSSRKDLPPELSPSKMFAAFRSNAAGQAKFFVDTGTLNLAMERTGGSLRDALKPVADDLEAFTAYTVARRAADLKQQGRSTVFSDEQVTQGLNLWTPEREAAAKAVTEWSDRVMDYVVEAGGLSKEEAALIRQMNPVWMPFYKAFGDSPGLTKSGRVGNAGSPIRELKGRKYGKIQDPLEGIWAWTNFMLEFGNKLRVQQAITRLATEGEGTPWFAKRMESGESVMSQARINSMLEAAGIDIGAVDMNAIADIIADRSMPTGKENIVRLWRDGKQESWWIHPDLYRVTMNMNKDALPAWMTLYLGAPKRAAQMGAVGLSPSFGVVRNPIRDAWTLSVYSKGKATNPLSAAEGLWHEMRNSPEAQLYRGTGMEFTTVMGLDRVEARRFVDLALNDQSYAATVIKDPAAALELTREFIGVFEHGPRVKEFADTLAAAEAKYGKGSLAAKVEAMLAAKDVTVNFTRAGYYAEAINQLIPFFNARVQGASKFFRTFGGAEGKQAALQATAKAFQYITVPSMLLWWVNKDQEWYQRRDRWEKNAFWMFSFDDGETIHRIPKPFELGYVFGSVPEAALQTLYDKDPLATSAAVWDAVASFMPVSNYWEAVPQAFRPIGEAATNTTGFPSEGLEVRNIVSPHLVANRAPSEQYLPSTPDVIKDLNKRWAEMLGEEYTVPTYKIQHMLDGYSGGFVGRAERTIGNFPPSRPEDYPIIGTLYGRQAGSRYLTDMYDEKERITQLKGSDKATKDELSKLYRINYYEPWIASVRDQVEAGKLTEREGAMKLDEYAKKALGED